MASWQSDTQLNADQTLATPPEVAKVLARAVTLHVTISTDSSVEDSGWWKLTAERFQSGYAPGDAFTTKGAAVNVKAR